MTPLLDRITEQKTTATAAAGTLREQIAKLSAELALIDTELPNWPSPARRCNG